MTLNLNPRPDGWGFLGLAATASVHVHETKEAAPGPQLTGGHMYSIDHTVDTMQLPSFLKEVTNHSFVTEVPDNSMAPEFRAGDHIHVDLDLKPIDGCFVVAILAGTTEAVLRQYEGRGDDGFTLRAFDSDYPSLGVDSEVDATIVGAVIERHRSILPRTVSVEE